MHMNRAKGVLAAVSLATAGAVAAQGPAAQFSADAVQMAPDKQIRTARMFVGEDRVRMEYKQDGKRVAELVDWKQGRAVLLMLDEGTYLEKNVPPPSVAVQPKKAHVDGPCEAIPLATCQHLGQETLSGRQVDKWEMVLVRDGKSERSLHWVDRQRHMPLRQFWPDGSITELKPLGNEILNDRAVEKWEQVSTKPSGESTRALQWYDPELQIAIREELPSGSYRELRNIRVAVQPIKLFEIPAGMQRVQIPVRPMEQAGPGQYPSSKR